MKKLIILLASILLWVTVEAAEFMPFTSLTGGVTGSLDNEPVANISVGDVGFVVTSDGNAYIYVVDDTDADENSPFVVAPDDVGESTLRWILVSINFDGGNFVKNSGEAGALLLYEANGSDTTGSGWKGPDSVSANTYFKFASSVPLAYGLMQFSAKSSDTSTQSWVPNIQHRTVVFDPKVVCDGALDRVKLFEVGTEAPNGIIITQWKCWFEVNNPTTEITMNLRRHTTYFGAIGVGTLMDTITTSSGTASETTYTNINGGSTVANGQYIFLDIPSAYTEVSHQIIFEIWYYVVGG